MQYVQSWGNTTMPPSKLTPTTFLIRNQLTTASGGAPYWDISGQDSIDFVKMGTNYAYEDSLKIWAKANNVRLIEGGLFNGSGWGSSFYTYVSDTSVGGAGDGLRKAWLGSCQRHACSGIEIDCEYPPNTDAYRKAFDVWIRRVRADMSTWTPKGVIMLTTSSWWLWSANAATPEYLASTVANVDYVVLMEYNMNKGSLVSFNSPLHHYPGGPAGGYGSLNYWDDGRTKAEYYNSGVPTSKMVFLSSGEIKWYTGSGAMTPGSSASQNGGYWSATSIPQNYFNSSYWHWNDSAKCSYFSDGASWTIVPEGYQSMLAKVNFVQNYLDPMGKHLAGIGVYDVGRWYDNRQAFPDSAIKGMVTINGGIILPPDTTHVPPPPPSAPVLASPSNGAVSQPTSVTLLWYAVSGATTYRIQISTNSSFSTTIIDDSMLTVASQSLSSLANNNTYYWRVRAKSSSGISGWSGIWSFTTVALLPPPSTSDNWLYQDTIQFPWRDSSWNSVNIFNSAAQVYAGSFSLKAVEKAWGAVSLRSGRLGSPVDINPSLYSRIELAVYNTTPNLTLNIYCYNDRGDVFPIVLQNAVPVNQWTIISVPMAQLNPNNYVIDRVNIQNYTSLSPTFYLDNIRFVGIAAANTPPAIPVLLSPANGVTDLTTSPTLTWNLSSGATSYQVQISGNAGFTQTVFNDSTLTAGSRRTDSLANGVTYYWHVRAKNTAGWSAYSTPWSFTMRPTLMSDQWLYVDGLVAPWNSLSWNSVNIYTSTVKVYAGTYSLKATQFPWGAVSLQSGALGGGIDVNPALYGSFEFAVYNTTTNLTLNVYCYNDRGDVFPIVLQNNVPVKQWTIISIPMTQLDPNGYTIHRINIQNYTRINHTFYLDNIRFVAGTASLSSAQTKQRVLFDPEFSTADNIPGEIALKQNYPNPFNPTTQIDYQLPDNAYITLIIYNVLGGEVIRLADGVETAGFHTEVWNAGNSPSGIYFSRLTVTDLSGKQMFQQTRRMVLIK
jgi:hypothetical protein